MLNVVAIMGRLAFDPQMRQTQSGKHVASLRIACDRGRKDANGNMQADWFDVICWEQRADFVCKYFQRGSLIAVDGRLQSRSYTDKHGNNRVAIEILAQNINFAGSKSNSAASGMDAGQAAAPAPAQSYAAVPESDSFAYIEDNDDLPF